MKTTISVILLGLAAVTQKSVATDNMVFPASPKLLPTPRRCGTSNPFSRPSRYQQVYNSTAFATGAVPITQIAFRADAGFDFDGLTTDKIIVSISTTDKTVDGLSTTFAQNLDKNNIQEVFNGKKTFEPIRLNSNGIASPYLWN
jgi:hypothetical protein